MNIDLKGKNALVCGSSKGIGKAAAFELAELGANITLIARSSSMMESIIQQLPNHQQQHNFLTADFTCPDNLKTIVNDYTATKPMHILINNTGGPSVGPLMQTNEDDFINAYTTHLICNHILAKAVIPCMQSEGYGRIINVISTSVKAPIPGFGVSNTVRGAVANWAKSLAHELGPCGITVNNVLPGATHTERLHKIIETKATRLGRTKSEIIAEMQDAIPLGRFAEAREIASAIAFLASPAAAYITGIALVVDGGRLGNL